MLLALIVIVTVFLAYANGANDNFKGVATLYGDGTLSYRQALSTATVMQILGSIASVIFAAALVKAFSGKGLVAPEISASQDFLIAVGFGGALTVMLATVVGFPISTTHALTGALAGTAFLANGYALDLSEIGKSFFLPLLLSPILAVATAGPLFVACRSLSGRFDLTPDSCICVGAPEPAPALQAVTGSGLQMAPGEGRRLFRVASMSTCRREDFDTGIVMIPAQKILRVLHLFSASALCFARGLNDTPKIVAIIFAANAFRIEISLAAIALAMAAGGIIHARKVAERISKKVTPLNEPQALIANLVSSFYVIGASRLGLPVSTTHISVSAISAVGLANKSANLIVIRDILLSWLLTLPAAAIFGMVTYIAFQSIGV